MPLSEAVKRRAELLNQARVKRELAAQARVLALNIDDEVAQASLLGRSAEFLREAAELVTLAAVLVEKLVEGEDPDPMSPALRPPA